MKYIKLFVMCTLLLALTGCIKQLELVRMNEVHLVNKNYPQENETNNLSFAYAEPELKVIMDVSSELKNGLMKRIEYVGGRVKCHLNDELDKIILSKGFTITDRYRSRRYMTFSEKRNTTALFYPEINIRIVEQSDLVSKGIDKFDTAGTLEINADVNIVMREPMSDEIIWIKSIPVQEVSDSFQYNNAFWAGKNGQDMMLNTQFYRVGRGQKHSVPENLKVLGEKIDAILEEVDKKIVDATIHFVEAEEFSFLNSDIKKLKKMNRY